MASLMESAVRLDFIKSNPILRMHYCVEGERIIRKTNGGSTSFSQILDKNREDIICKFCYSLNPKILTKKVKKCKVFVIKCKVCGRKSEKTFELNRKQKKVEVSREKNSVDTPAVKQKKRKKEENAGLTIPPKMLKLSSKLSDALSKQSSTNNSAEDRLKRMLK